MKFKAKGNVAGIVNGVSAGVAFLNRGFVNLTGRYIPSVAGLNRNVLQVMNTCSRICSFVRNSGFGISCAMGVAGLITTSLCTGRGLSGILFTAPSKNDYSIYNRGNCLNPYNGSCSGCHFIQIFFGMGNVTIFSSIVLKKLYQYCKRYILRAGVVPPISNQDIELLLGSAYGLIALGVSLLDSTGRTDGEGAGMFFLVLPLIYLSTSFYLSLALLRLEMRYAEPEE